MLVGWQIFYGLTAIMFLSLAYLFYKAKDGYLRILLILFFIFNALGMGVRLVCGFYEVIDSIWNYIIILPVFLITLILVLFLNSYINKNKEI